MIHFITSRLLDYCQHLRDLSLGLVDDHRCCDSDRNGDLLCHLRRNYIHCHMLPRHIYCLSSWLNCQICKQRRSMQAKDQRSCGLLKVHYMRHLSAGRLKCSLEC